MADFLYPSELPKLDVTMSDLKGKTYQEIAYLVMKQFLTDFTEEELKKQRKKVPPYPSERGTVEKVKRTDLAILFDRAFLEVQLWAVDFLNFVCIQGKFMVAVCDRGHVLYF